MSQLVAETSVEVSTCAPCALQWTRIMCQNVANQKDEKFKPVNIQDTQIAIKRPCFQANNRLVIYAHIG